jgi:integrase
VDRFGELLDAARHGRDRAVIAIGLYTFQRASELNRLTWDDIEDTHHDPTQWRIAVYRQKTEERDFLPLCQELRDELARWKLEYGNIMGEVPRGHWYVVPAFHHGEWGQGPDGRLRLKTPLKLNPTRRFHAPQKAVQAALNRIGYADLKHEGAHTLRRSGGLALYQELAWERGHDGALRIVQSMFGHKSLATTEHYLRLTLERKRRNDLLAGGKMFPERGGAVATLTVPGAANG